MRFVRSLAAGAVVIGAGAGIAIAGSGTASAIGFQPLPGGVQVDLNHAETVWAHQNNVGAAVGNIPNPSAQSFGVAFDGATELSSMYPKGRVSFSVIGPLNDLGGFIVAFEE